MPDYADTLAELGKAREEAKQLLSELRGVTKDAKSMKKEVAEFVNGLIHTVIQAMISNAIDEQMGTLERKLSESAETVNRRMNSGVNQVLDAMKEKEEFITECVDQMHKSIDIIAKVKEGNDKLNKRVEVLEGLYHHAHQLIDVHTERMDNTWRMLDAVDTINRAHQDRLEFLFAELGVAYGTGSVAEVDGGETDSPDEPNNGGAR